MKMKKILAVETSCDETAMSLIELSEKPDRFSFKILTNVVASQIDLHKKWGGVYPELASRAHLEAIVPVLAETMAAKTIKMLKSVDGIAVTAGPGLIGSLLMGVETANILGSFFSKPVISVNHLEGHIYSAFCSAIKNRSLTIPKKDIFPALALVVSGGHTSLILMNEHLSYKTVGQTLDDAAGEAFDKVAKILELGYPGGPAIEKLALSGNENAYELPLSMVKRDALDFSFSGLKTAVLYLTKNPVTGEKRKFNRADLAASFQKTVCEILTLKTIQAIKKYQTKTVILSGGVSANTYLREHFQKAIKKETDATILIPPKDLSTDNAVGIAIAGAMHYVKNSNVYEVPQAQPNWKIDNRS